MGVEQEADFVNFHGPLVAILDVFHFNKNGLYVNRVCPELVVPVYFLMQRLSYPKKKKKKNKIRKRNIIALKKKQL